MKTIKPILGKDLSFYWRQAIAQNQTRGLTLKNLLRYRGLTNDFKYKEHETFLLDILICGNNPIINTLFLYKLNEFLNVHSNHKKLKVGILLEKDALYWGYHTFENSSFLNEIKLKTGHLISESIESFIQNSLKSISSLPEIEIVFIENSNIEISNINYDEFTHSHIIHLISPTEKPSMFSPQMKKTIVGENEIRKKYEKIFLSSLSKNQFSQLTFSKDKKHSIDSQLHSHILITKQVFFTSLPTWLDIENTETSINDEEYISFTHKYSPNSFASAKHCAKDFKQLSYQAINDFIELNQYPFSKIFPLD